MKINNLTAAIGLALISAGAIAAPSAPQISWEPQTYSFVDVNLEGNGSYKQIVQAKDVVTVNIKWNSWSGTGGDSYKVYFDNQVVNQGPLAAGTKGGTVSFPYTKSGRHTLYLEICDSTGCAKSAGKPIVIADTDGGHLQPLTMDVDPRNKNNGTIPGMVTGAYFVEWGIYGRDFDVSNIPAQNLTHLLYGFIPICGANESLKEIENGNSWRALQKACADSQDYEVVIHDPWAAVQKTLPGTDNNDPIRGTYAQLMALKQRYPDLKILPSVGGWTLSDPFHGFTTKANRDTFVASMKQFLKTWKFYDGVDIDWEFPGGDGPNPGLGDPINDGPAYIALMKELRVMLDELELETGRKYELTSAIGSGYDKIEDVDYQVAQQYMDYIFAMTYDFYGGWNNVTGHQTGIYCGSHLSQGECDGTGLDDNGEPRKGPAYTLDNAVKALLAQGVNPKKLVVGAAMYGRGWEGVFDSNTTIPGNPMTAPGNGKYAGSTSEGVWEPGIMDYKAIAKNLVGSNGSGINGFTAGYDDQAEAAWVWNPTSGKLLTYDSPRSVYAKGQYVNLHDLGGLFAWEIDADNGDILNAMYDGLTGGVPTNRAPIVSVDSSLTLESGKAGALTVTASDPEGAAVTYAWTSQGLTLTNANTATVGITAPNVTVDTTFSLKIAVTDDKNATTEKTVSVLVKAEVPAGAPVVQPIANVSVEENKSVNVSVVATDPNNDPLTYTWNVPTGLTASGSGANVTLSAGEVAQDTTYTVTVDVSDGSATTSASFDVTVTDAASSVAPWDASKVYVGGDLASHNGKVYRAKWWTRGEEPGKAMVWQAL
ncbi:glycosyl hydrolase family 18 protein [Pseudoalteromonas sp. SMS1]|uniref:glycosyl hydrolase family 18 protein n=1 Tax=Pseudoalteromonas sp. SMS1 TaxID=2908894 RepID=UPI001F2E4A36|nr:glycosyl hydrolase family 18 protein [Pseudoalteromonas sp. SMS1]MCF2855845.1 glycosyl hydrolase family 18 protein [Pseudoalteromonas sp. SMS1]